MKKSKLIPFSFMPGAWGLNGKVRDEAEAYYYYDGEDLDRRLNEIHGRTTAQDNLELDRKYGRVTEYEYDKQIAEMTPEPNRVVALLDVEFKHGKISENAYEKAVATAEERPWIKVINDGFESDGDAPSFHLEFDWNIHFVEYLSLNGYTGATEEDIVEKWFQELCRSQVAETDELSFQMGDRYL